MVGAAISVPDEANILVIAHLFRRAAAPRKQTLVRLVPFR
jgi:hypothetical protein